MRPQEHVAPGDHIEPGHTLYRCYDANGNLLYIGQTFNPERRFVRHRNKVPWWGEVQRITLQRYRNSRVLEQDEQRAIYHEKPRYNTAGKTALPAHWNYRQTAGIAR